MLKTVSDVKDFISWAKSMGLKTAKLGDLEFTFEPSALTEKEPLFTTIAQTEPVQPDASTQEDEELLFWSSKG